jgi:hypothetical protein
MHVFYPHHPIKISANFRAQAQNEENLKHPWNAYPWKLLGSTKFFEPSSSPSLDFLLEEDALRAAAFIYKSLEVLGPYPPFISPPEEQAP